MQRRQRRTGDAAVGYAAARSHAAPLHRMLAGHRAGRDVSPAFVGDSVQVINPELTEYGVCGEVCGYDPEAQWYVVDLDTGPLCRGRYEESELEPA